MIWVKALIDQTYTGNKYYVEHINKKHVFFVIPKDVTIFEHLVLSKTVRNPTIHSIARHRKQN